jgi:prephenate dehydrogenase
LRVAVVGLGWIGGSIALAAREHAGASVTGWDADVAAIDTAVEHGMIDRRSASLEETVADAEVVFIAAPVGSLPELVAQVLRCAPDDCAVTDVGSTKRTVVDAHSDPRFVGGHPLAGSEAIGAVNARADMFDGATWYLTPAGTTSASALGRVRELVVALRANPVELDADVHDELMAVVSQLPHVFANVLVAQATDARFAGHLEAGPSFRDATRVAGANTAVWTDIYMSNRDALGTALDEAITRLTHVREALTAGDASVLAQWNDGAAVARRHLLEGRE